MNTTQRVYAAISGETPDRVPAVPKIWVDLAAKLTGTELTEVIKSPFTALEVIAEAGVELGLDAVRQFHFPERKIAEEGAMVYEIGANGEKLGTIDMNGGLSTHLFDAADYDFKSPETMAYHHFWSADEPVIKNVEDAKNIAVPDKTVLKQLGWEKNQKAMLQKYGGDICLIGDCSSATLAFYVCLRGMNNAMFDLVESPKLVHAVMEKGEAIAIEKGKLNIDMGMNVLRLNDSVANMMVISPAHWREFIKPHMKAVCDELHSYSKDVKIYCHICGNVLPVIEDIAETGIDCIGPLDPMGGFTAAQARKRVGSDVSLMGGVNTMSFVNSTQEEIMSVAREVMRGAGKHGGFILGSGCVVPRSAKKENLLALVSAAKEYGKYKDGRLENE